MEKNLKRLLGVVLGKVIPIIILGNLDFFGCQNSERFFMQALFVYIFIFAFEYIYFTSPNWGYVGGLIAAFGCYPLMAYPTHATCEGSGSSSFTSNYEELCEVTTCILLQMVVDVLGERQSARDKALKHIEKATAKAQDCLNDFFEGTDTKNSLNAKALRDTREDAMAALGKAASKIADVDPSKLVAPGPDTPFNLSLYTKSISILHLLLSDLSMIIMAIHEVKENQDEDNKESELTMKQILGKLTSWKKPENGAEMCFKDDTKNHVKNASDALLAILSKTAEMPFDGKDILKVFDTFEQMRLARDVSGKELMFVDCNNFVEEGETKSKQESGKAQVAAVKDVFAVRISVIVVACNNIVKHMGELSELCVEANIH